MAYPSCLRKDVIMATGCYIETLFTVNLAWITPLILWFDMYVIQVTNINYICKAVELFFER